MSDKRTKLPMGPPPPCSQGGPSSSVGGGSSQGATPALSQSEPRDPTPDGVAYVQRNAREGRTFPDATGDETEPSGNGLMATLTFKPQQADGAVMKDKRTGKPFNEAHRRPKEELESGNSAYNQKYDNFGNLNDPEGK